jgi:hypothetical protein
LNASIATYEFKNCSTRLENFGDVVLKEEPNKELKMDIIKRNIANAKACRDYNIRPQVEWIWKHILHDTYELSNHQRAKGWIDEAVRIAMEIFFTPAFCYWLDKPQTVIDRRWKDVWKSYLDFAALKERLERQRKFEELRNKQAQSIKWKTNPEAAKYGDEAAGEAKKQMYDTTQKVKGKKKFARRKKFDDQRDEREQHLQESDGWEPKVD